MDGRRRNGTAGSRPRAGDRQRDLMDNDDADDTIIDTVIVEHDDGATAVSGLATGRNVRRYIVRNLSCDAVDALMRDIERADDVDATLATWQAMQE
jgi:hypothetical protein